jgi:hypothetical protein
MKISPKSTNGQKKLALMKETLRQLSGDQLKAAVGGLQAEAELSNNATTTRLCQ